MGVFICLHLGTICPKAASPGCRSPPILLSVRPPTHEPNGGNTNEQEQGENAKKIKALRLELKKDESKRMDLDDFLKTVRQYTDATTITKRMVAELIDHIEVYHAEKQDGVTNQRVDIHYNCIGAFDVPDRRKIPEADIIMETRKGVALSYAPEQVAV